MVAREFFRGFDDAFDRRRFVVVSQAALTVSIGRRGVRSMSLPPRGSCSINELDYDPSIRSTLPID
jgi:hypothetical protein